MNASEIRSEHASAGADLEAIKQLKARYFRLLDTQQWEAWGQVFTHDARLHWGPRPEDAVGGRDEIVRAVSAALAGARTCHHGHMPEIELLDATRARGIWAMFDWVDHPRYDLKGYGHYHEEYVKQDGAWRIRRSRLVRLREDRIPRG
jgi:3-phenylpropionate/cinnamic acid dioxygenase small subunit